MKHITKILLVIFLTLSGNPTFGQMSTKLICKEWKLMSFEEEDGKFAPSPDQVGDRMRFQPDHKVDYIELSKLKSGMWKYDSKSKMLTVTDNQTNENKAMKVVKITDTEFVLESKNATGEALKMYMVAVIRRPMSKR